MKFWLGLRENAEADCLPYIGDLELAATDASLMSPANIVETLVKCLVEQRCRLQQITRISGVTCECVTGSTDIVDLHAACALRVLDEQGFEVPPSLRPASESIYKTHMTYQGLSSPFYTGNIETVKLLELLYNAGFRDIAKGDTACCQDVFYSPMHLWITRYHGRIHRRALSGFFEVTDWFLSKGISITYCWPRSKITTLHLVSAGAARLYSSMFEEATPKHALNRTADLFRHTLTDDCECSCSTHGCTNITSFCKDAKCCIKTKEPNTYEHVNILPLIRPGYVAAFKDLEERDSTLRKFKEIVQCVAKAVGGVAHRWIVTEFIRLCVFSWLGIRHTCCDLDKIWFADESNLSCQPLPRYPPDELQRIQEEDAYLTVVLDMVPLFNARYDTHEGDLQSFVDDILLPEMETVLDRLKQEDEATYAASRREMGVVMVDECESGA